MKTIIIKTQEELDKIKEVKVDEKIIISEEADLILNSKLSVYGILEIKGKLETDWIRNKYISAYGNSVIRNDYSTETKNE